MSPGFVPKPWDSWKPLANESRHLTSDVVAVEKTMETLGLICAVFAEL